jgi:hypothetical protein
MIETGHHFSFYKNNFFDLTKELTLKYNHYKISLSFGINGPINLNDDLSDGQWKHFEPLISIQIPKLKKLDYRVILNGILWIYRTKSSWLDLPERYGKSESVYGKFLDWKKKGVWKNILIEIQSMMDQRLI